VVVAVTTIYCNLFGRAEAWRGNWLSFGSRLSRTVAHLAPERIGNMKLIVGVGIFSLFLIQEMRIRSLESDFLHIETQIGSLADDIDKLSHASIDNSKAIASTARSIERLVQVK